MSMTKEEKMAVSNVVFALLDTTKFLIKVLQAAADQGVKVPDLDYNLCVSVDLASDAVEFLGARMRPKTDAPAATPDCKAN